MTSPGKRNGNGKKLLGMEARRSAAIVAEMEEKAHSGRKMCSRGIRNRRCGNLRQYFALNHIA
ncbi:hypothetical protein AM571_CH01114 [Rhizobium etli 8C-3]|uniref:Uncharacterized protein n=1 Tax=Rhizobium etli 8C-3 TaxID=538025 RepID=A0A1L5P1G3_RHIET|nr:hypothetical protein AM571_CH01114 [Rhizobium etli 8C-3]